jgi:hypothetical protein
MDGGQRDHNQYRALPLLPGTTMPTADKLPGARVYQPPRSVMQAAPGRREWVLEFEPAKPLVIDPLMGWSGGADPLSQIRLRFPDLQSAITYAEWHGLQYEVMHGRETLLPRKWKAANAV